MVMKRIEGTSWQEMLDNDQHYTRENIQQNASIGIWGFLSMFAGRLICAQPEYHSSRYQA